MFKFEKDDKNGKEGWSCLSLTLFGFSRRFFKLTDEVSIWGSTDEDAAADEVALLGAQPPLAPQEAYPPGIQICNM